MDPSPKAQVLAFYRQLRTAGMSPYAAMTAIRNDWANLIAQGVSQGYQPAPATVATWRAANDYLHSMAGRGTYWFRVPRHGHDLGGRHIRPRPSRLHRLIGRKIPA